MINKEKLGRSNRRKGLEAQNEWAKRIGGTNVGRLGAFDVLGPDGCAWEVKSYAKVQEHLIIAALEQAEYDATIAADSFSVNGRDYGVAFRLRDRPEARRWLVVRWG